MIESQNVFIKMLADECREMIDAEIGKASFTTLIAECRYHPRCVK
jgi:hypothetical protein